MSTFESLSFYRGVSSRHEVSSISLRVSRSDRRPRNTAAAFHAFADHWFERRFGVLYRSQALFVTSSIPMARSYAASDVHVVRVLPVSEYRYCWSPRVADLLKLSTSSSSAGATEWARLLDGADYREDDLSAARDCGHEVMLWCRRYVTIPASLLNIKVGDEPFRLIE